MKAAQAGDGAAYAQLLKLAVPIITRVVSSQHPYGLEIDDIVQDVLLSLHYVRHTYDPGRRFIPWLATIAHHRLIDAQRRRIRITQNEDAVPELLETFSDDQTNWEVAGQGDPELLKRAIADLPIGQRHAVELLKLQELSLKEASAVSGISVAALKVAAHRGMKALRARLTGEAPSTKEKAE
ncbi:MAG: sigma-70 family RNA polymerase sigma factor [Alphaproteobacteria bacterium]|nr:sigma-70 family RNA polymerase sigma factor [Alphaproteobacteria bacterium]